MSFDKNDLNYYKAFKAVVMRAKFETQGEALIQVGALFQWFNSLENKIDAQVNLEKNKQIRKELK